MIRNAKLTALGLLLIPCLAIGLGCESQGPAERAGEKIDKGIDTAGEKIDKGIDKVEDAVNPPGPAEKAGEAVDDAVKP